jgi:formylglycine-generating enzyme required for sulfatase activity
MPRWFLSYHTPEHALAQRLKAGIEQKDPTSHVFFAPTHLRAGGSWSKQLADEIENSTAFILLIGEHGLGDWQVYEYDEALDRRVKSQGAALAADALDKRARPSGAAACPDARFGDNTTLPVADYPLILVLLEGHSAPGLPFLRRLHWIVTDDPASDKTVARLFAAAAGAGTNPHELWRFSSPYRGLEAMEEKDSDYFFGRGRETVEVLNALAKAPGRLPVLLGNSGVGKSSLAQAGVLAALKRQAWPEDAGPAGEWPHAFENSRRWCFLTLQPGEKPLETLIEPFLQTWQFDPTDPRRERRRIEWLESLQDGKATLSNLLNATADRLREIGQPEPPRFLLYINQGEELYVRSVERQRRRFSEVLAGGLADPRLVAFMSLRADFLGELQRDEPLYNVHDKVDVPPLRAAELRKVVSRPAELLSARFEPPELVEIITRRTAEDSVTDVGALPLLSYTLDDMWTQMTKGDEGALRVLAQTFELGAVLVERANKFLGLHPGDEAALRRVLTLRLATVREDGEPTRRRASRKEFSQEEWRLVGELANFPYRLLVTVTTKSGETYAEIAHEAIFRRWDKLRDWIAAEREFLAWRSGLEAARRAWEAAPDDAKSDTRFTARALARLKGILAALHRARVAPPKDAKDESDAARRLTRLKVWLAAVRGASDTPLKGSKSDALLVGLALAQAKHWLAQRADDIPEADQQFTLLSRQAEQKRKKRVKVQIGAAATAGVMGLIVWLNYASLQAVWHWYTVTVPFMRTYVMPYVVTAEKERQLKAGDTFRECMVSQVKDYCPQMVVVPAGSFTMGSPPTETGRNSSEGPQHSVTIGRAFAVAASELTFDEWDTCATYGDCSKGVLDGGFGRGQRPVIDVTWDDAQRYVKWLSTVTGKTYRLLTEAEYEYAARAGTQTPYPWGNDFAVNDKPMANCNGCGSIPWDNNETAPINSFPANNFGLSDMVGNIWEWVQDCFHPTFDNAPLDGSAWTTDCPDRTYRAVRGGSWLNPPNYVRSANRFKASAVDRDDNLGFRVARDLTP